MQPLHFISRVFRILCRFAHYYHSAKGKTKKELMLLKAKFPEFFDIQTKKETYRIKQYAILSLVLGKIMSLLLGFKLSEKETIRLFCLSLLIPFGDDFFDNPEHSSFKALKDLIHSPATFNASTPKTQVMRFLAEKLYADLNNLDEFKSAVTDVFEVLIKEKENPIVGIEKLKHRTFEKGGKSALLYRMLLEIKIQKGEKDFFYILGGLFQLMDDIFDVYEDNKNGLPTLMREISATEVEELYKNELRKAKELLWKLRYPVCNKKRFYLSILLVLGRGFVALDKLKQLKKQFPNKDWSQFSRKELICDMEKPKNLLRSLVLIFPYK